MAINIKKFVFNPFQENTYLVYDESGECVIIDAGCSTPDEQDILSGFIETGGLKPVKLINTHCHVDHIMGNGYIYEKFGLKTQAHKDETDNFENAPEHANIFGVKFSPPHTELIELVFVGDVLFKDSIGRTDLPGGNYETLIISIKEKLFSLGDEFVVYSGHGPESAIGEEKRSNPFLV